MTHEEKIKRIVGELKKLFPEVKTALDYNSDFNLLVAVMLSAQTTDKQVNLVSPPLFKDYRMSSDYVKLEEGDLEKFINKIGLYRGKARNILKTSKIIHDKYNDKLPDNMTDLVALPGVGRKTANIVLSVIYNKNEGIAVDTHVKRLSQLFGFTTNSNPDKIERDLMDIVPRSEWKDFTLRMIDYGRKYCPAHCKHTDCPLKEFII